jgi:hypothetical protein
MDFRASNAVTAFYWSGFACKRIKETAFDRCNQIDDRLAFDVA